MNHSRIQHVAACVVLVASTAVGQVTPSSQAPAESDEVIKLEEFDIVSDIGSYSEVEAITASKSPIALRDLPKTVSVLNEAFIADLRAQHMSDLYQYITGLSYNDFRNADGFSIRGMPGSTNIKNIQVDGMPGLASRFNSPPTSNLDRVEVLKGPAAVLYGYMEPGGLVNLVTKKPQAERSAEIFTSVGTYATGLSSGISPILDDVQFTTVIDFTGALDAAKRWRYRLVADYEYQQKFRRNVVHKNVHVFPSLSYVWSPDTSLTVGLEYLQENRNADEGLVAPLNRTDLVAAFDVVYQNPDDHEEDNGVVLFAEFSHRFENDWSLRLAGRSVRHNDYGYLFRVQSIRNAVPVENTEVQRRLREQYNERNYDYLDLVLQGKVKIGERDHRLLIGATGGDEQNAFDQRASTGRYGNDPAWRVNVYNPVLGAPKPASLPGNFNDTKIKSFGIYGQAHFNLSEQLKVLASARYDKTKQDFLERRGGATGRAESSATVPSGGVVYQPTKNLSLYASYAESFHPVLNSFNAEDINGNSGNWDPEEATQKEIGFKWDLPSPELSLTVALFDIEKTNIIEQTGMLNPNGNEYWIPVGSLESKGGEVELQYRPRPNIQLRTGYAYVDAKLTGGLDPSTINAPQNNVPRHQFNLWARYNFKEGVLRGFGVGLGGIYQSERLGIITNNPANQFTMASYVKLDGALYYNWKSHSLALNLYNLTDKRYLPGGGTGTTAGNNRITPGPPRQMILSFRTRF